MASVMAKRSCVETLVIIDAMLSRDEGATRRQLADAIGCSTVSVSRYLRWLRDDLGVEFTKLGNTRSARWFYGWGQPSIFTAEVRQRLQRRTGGDA